MKLLDHGFGRQGYDNHAVFEKLEKALKPDGWTDDSYGNDVCPSLALWNSYKDEYPRYKLWVDWADYDSRECGGKMLTLHKYNEDGFEGELFETDSRAEMIDFIEEREMIDFIDDPE